MCAKVKARADQLVFEQGLTGSREQARRLIMAGKVAVAVPEGSRALPVAVDKPGHIYPADTVFLLLGAEQYVSRGAYKLLTIMDAFHMDVTDYVCLDAGASTGGFTDCLLQHGAKRVYAVDVGHNQLHEKLRSDPRVISHEGCNLRTAPEDLIPEKVDLVVADVSFISLTLILPPCMRWLKEGGLVATLIKPQFEAGREKVGKKGVVRDPAVHLEVLEHFLTHAKESHFTVLGITYSPIRGPEGNIEYLGYLKKCDEPDGSFDLPALVAESHSQLKD